MSVVIISGSRSINDYGLLHNAIIKSGFVITEIVEGECPRGVDQLAKRYGKEHGIPVIPFPADWNDLSYPDAVIKKNKSGKLYDAKAGFRRNEEMAKYASGYAGQCLMLWDGISPGTASMEKLAIKYKLRYFVAKVPYRQEPLLEHYG